MFNYFIHDRMYYRSTGIRGFKTVVRKKFPYFMYAK